MNEPQTKVVADSSSDLLNQLVGIESESSLGKLRAQRADIASYIQGSYNALLEPAEEAGASRGERGLIALRVAVLEQSPLLIDYYRNYLKQQTVADELVAATERAQLGAPLTPRLLAILAHVDMLTTQPRLATPENLAELKANGLDDANIVSISQLIAFLSFQVRTIVGLQLLGGMR